MFLFSHVIFTVGCVFFLPSVAKKFGRSDSLGAWLCIIGSFGLCFAVFYTALTFSTDPAVLKMLTNLDPSVAVKCRQLTKVQMFLSLVGAMFFTVGSFMYRPVFGGKCPQGSKNAVCMAVQDYGNVCYLMGSYVFLMGSLLGLYITYLKTVHPKKDDVDSEASDIVHVEGAKTYNSV